MFIKFMISLLLSVLYYIECTLKFILSIWSNCNIFRLQIVLLLTVFVLTYLYLKLVVYSYFKRHKIPHVNPTMILGNLPKEAFTQKTTFGMAVQKNYDQLKYNPFHGMYILFSPVLAINDADIIKNILIKDFHIFSDRGLYYNEKVDPLTQNFFFLPGQRWKILRTKFSAIFTPNKFKGMFSLLKETSDEGINVFNENLMKSDIIDIKDILSRYVLDGICTIFFGFNPHSLHDPESAFRYYGNLAIENRPIINALGFFAPEILNIFRIPFINPKASEFFSTIFKDMIKKRQRTKEKRNDFVDFMIELMDQKKITNEKSEYKYIMDDDFQESSSSSLSLMEAAAQAFAFFVAGFETSSTTMTYFLQEVAENPKIQDKLHKEIDDFLDSHIELTLENLKKLEYLDMVLNETMRKHPIVPILNRRCLSDYKVENSNYIIPKGMRISISVYGIHHDPDIYPDPEKFDPTRFDKKNTASRHPCYFLPFGIGPRYCIGKRLAIAQSKLILIILLSKYHFSICEKTTPITYSRQSILHTPISGVYLRMHKRLH